MSSSNGMRVLLLVAPSLFFLLPTAALIVILERIAQSIFTHQVDRNWRTGDREITLQTPANSTSSTSGTTDITFNDNVAPTVAYLLLSLVVILVSCANAFGMFELRRIEGSIGMHRVWVWFILLTNLAIMAGGIGILSWASSIQAGEGWNSYGDVGNDQRVTRETWACDISRFFPSEDWAGTVCGLSKATRFMLIPLIIAALVAIGVLWMVVRRRGGVAWLFGGEGRYGGFENEYEMNSQKPVPPYQFQPGPQQYHPQQYHPNAQGYHQGCHQGYAQPAYPAPPPQAFPPAQYQPVQKGAPTADEAAVFR